MAGAAVDQQSLAARKADAVVHLALRLEPPILVPISLLKPRCIPGRVLKVKKAALNKRKIMCSYLAASSPMWAERMATEVPSIGSHRREMGGKI